MEIHIEGGVHVHTQMHVTDEREKWEKQNESDRKKNQKGRELQSLHSSQRQVCLEPESRGHKVKTQLLGEKQQYPPQKLSHMPPLIHTNPSQCAGMLVISVTRNY